MTIYSPAGRGDNALQRVVFILQFTSEFSGEDFERFDQNSKAWRDDLPRRSVTNAVLLQTGSNKVAFDGDKVVGLSYEALMKDGSVEFGLRFDESRILFLTGKYTNWAEIWPQASSYLKMAMELVPSGNPVLSFATEYTDLFQARGEYSDFDPGRILRSGSRYVPPHVLDRKENLHFHTGFFEKLSDPVEHRLLTRINADLKDNEEKKTRDFSIVLFHQLSSHQEPWGDAMSLPKEVLDRGLDNFVNLHEIDKSVLREILNDEMCKGIGL